MQTKGELNKVMNIKEFLNRYGVDTTTNFQLLHWAKQLGLKNFHVLMRDEIREAIFTKLPVNIIINIDPKKDGGVHWSCFHITADGKKYWFDSYGLPPLKEIINKFRRKTKSVPADAKSPIMAADFQIQDFGMKYCGQLALYVLYRLSKADVLKGEQSSNFLKILLDLAY